MPGLKSVTSLLETDLSWRRMMLIQCCWVILGEFVDYIASVCSDVWVTANPASWALFSGSNTLRNYADLYSELNPAGFIQIEIRLEILHHLRWTIFHHFVHIYLNILWWGIFPNPVHLWCTMQACYSFELFIYWITRLGSHSWEAFVFTCFVHLYDIMHNAVVSALLVKCWVFDLNWEANFLTECILLPHPALLQSEMVR